MSRPPTSQVTFLYFSDLSQAKDFFSRVLELELVSDQGWACIWRTGEKAFVGAVDATRGSIKVEQRGGVLVSFTVENVDSWYERLQKHELTSFTGIKHFADIGLRSFFFKGPDGYDFEVQEFTDPEMKSLF